MKKILSIFLIGFIAVGILIPTHFASAVGVADVLDYTTGFALAPVILPIIVVITTLCSFLLIITGQLLDLVVQWSIFDMASIIGSGSAIGRAVLDSWGAIRDLANIFFIFILLYAAFSAMFNFSFGSFGKTVVNIIIVALLINFSMFFTKVVIDASNIVTTGFYQIISESNKEVVVNNQVQGNIMGIGSGRYTNLSAAYMRVLNIQTVFGTFDISMFRSTRMIIYGIFGSSIMLILALILFSIAMMLITRFIVLIYLMVLSPAAILCIALPKMRTYFDKWLSSLLSQAFFAPVFFALLWIALRIGSEVNVAIRAGNTGKFEFTNIMSEDPTSGVAVLFSYILILGMTLAAMRAAKSIASSAAGFTTINNYATSITAATGAWVGRKSFGWAGDKVASSTTLQREALKERKGLGDSLIGGSARAVMYGAKAAQNSTFDIRNAKLPTGMIGDAIEGTVGRTSAGKWLNLNDVKVPDTGVAAIAGVDLGKGGTKGYKEIKDESKKRVREEDDARKAKLADIDRREKILAGIDPAATSADFDEMQKTLSSMSEKQIEAFVESNRQVLNSLNFANAIGVKQLEALNKSEKITDNEKDSLKANRFAEINAAMKTGASLTGTLAAKKIKGLSESELEMIDPNHIVSGIFIDEMKSGQIESVLKSNKFTTSQKDKIRDVRRKPLEAAIAINDVTAARNIIKRMGAKEIASLDYGSILSTPTMVAAYTPQFLKRLVPEMNPADVTNLGALLAVGGDPATQIWLTKPAGQDLFA